MKTAAGEEKGVPSHAASHVQHPLTGLQSTEGKHLVDVSKHIGCRAGKHGLLVGAAGEVGALFLRIGPAHRCLHLKSSAVARPSRPRRRRIAAE